MFDEASTPLNILQERLIKGLNIQFMRYDVNSHNTNN